MKWSRTVSREAVTTSAAQRSIGRGEIMALLTLIGAGVFIRLINISQPFIDWWSWRQSDNAMIAENYYRHGFSFFYPQMSYTGSAPGYVGSEFPLVTFAAALLYVPFGVQEWIGRVIGVIAFAASVPFLYMLVKKVSNQRSAFLAVGIYGLAPLSIFTSRSFMVDMPMLAFSLGALYLFSEWLERRRTMLLIAAGLATSLAILVKLPAVIIGLPLLYMAWVVFGWRLLLQRAVWGFAALSLIPPLLWYYHSYVVSTTSFPMSLFWEPSSLARTVGVDRYLGILRRVGTWSLTPLVSIGMLAGVMYRWPWRFGYVFHWWLVAIVLFVVFAGDGNARHAWYQLPIVPVAAALAGRACDAAAEGLARVTRTRWASVGVMVVFFGGLSTLSYTYTTPHYNSWQWAGWKAGRELDRIAPPGALVMVATNDCDPTPLYYTRRRGWHFVEKNDWCAGTPGNSRVAIENLEKLRGRGATFLVLERYTLWWLDKFSELREHLDSNYVRVRQTDEYVIFDVSARGKG